MRARGLTTAGSAGSGFVRQRVRPIVERKSRLFGRPLGAQWLCAATRARGVPAGETGASSFASAANVAETTMGLVIPEVNSDKEARASPFIFLRACAVPPWRAGSFRSPHPPAEALPVAGAPPVRRRSDWEGSALWAARRRLGQDTGRRSSVECSVGKTLQITVERRSAATSPQTPASPDSGEPPRLGCRRTSTVKDGATRFNSVPAPT